MRLTSQTVVKGAGPDDHLLQRVPRVFQRGIREVLAQLGLRAALAEARLGHQLVQALLSGCDCYTEPLIRSLETARRVNNILQQREGSPRKHIIIVERPARARLRHTYPVSALKRADVPIPEF